MKKIFLLFITMITCFSLTACGNSVEDYLQEYIKDELHDYVFGHYTDYETGELVKTTSINNDVATAILLLDGYINIDLDSLFTKAGTSLEKVTKTYEDMYIWNVSTAFNMTLVYLLLDLDLTSLENYFEDMTLSYIDATEGWGGVVYDSTYLTVINCLNMLGVNDSLKTELIAKFDNINDLSYIDADLASMIVISLQGSAHQDYLDYIYSKITYKGVSNWSGEMSCSSTSQVLMALMSEGIVYRNNALVDYVLSFRTTNGFKEYLDDENRDLSFASPQGFCALATAYLFEETSNKVLFY